ncbi:sulfotransferase family protein [Azospirillum griseum]|uniref:sulfotransferase family protein n=1 Tax=Azospirillum griseum TaxID=2496639 RepID=UPI001AECE5DF|nr:sulfotransferase family protein [Azospirillum griseum]
MDATITADTLFRLSDRIRADDDSLRALWLEPDGKYQTRPFRLDDLTLRVASLLADDLHHLPADAFPHLCYGWGRCRVGSTALANLFGEAGIPSFFQPIKALMRSTLTGDPPGSWQPPPAHEHAAIFSKDVAGPYLMAECLYNPLQMLIEGGYPADRLHLILLDRDPVRSLASWLTKWADRVPRDRLVAHFILASLNAIRVERYARREGVAVIHYAHEASRDPLRATAALFGHLGLTGHFSPQAVTDWGAVEAFDSDQSSLIFTKEPEVYFVPGIHRAGSGYRYIARDRGAVTDADIALIDRMGVSALYEAHATACVQELGLPLDLTDTVLGRNLSPTSRSAHPDPVPCLVA